MSEISEKCLRSRNVSVVLSQAETALKNEALRTIANELVKSSEEIILANRLDTAEAEKSGMQKYLLDRLTLNTARIEAMAEGVRQVAELPDPVGSVLSNTVRPNGMEISKVRVPIGVLGIIYEARPNVTCDCAALGIKSGNCVILRGSASALCSNRKIVEIIHRALSGTEIPVDSVLLCEDASHESVSEMMNAVGMIDVIIPRGGKGLISRVVRESKVPVIETGAGNCTIFINDDAKPEMACDIVVNAKTSRVSVCNAAESLLLAQGLPDDTKRLILSSLQEHGVVLHASPEIAALVPDTVPAEEGDWEREYLALEMSVKTVNSVDEAINYINRYGTGHTDCIVTQSQFDAERFIRGCKSAVVNHNVSTRFTDGFEFGFGAEIGISTGHLHARGPVGLNELCIYKYAVRGNGQIRK